MTKPPEEEEPRTLELRHELSNPLDNVRQALHRVAGGLREMPVRGPERRAMMEEWASTLNSCAAFLRKEKA